MSSQHETPIDATAILDFWLGPDLETAEALTQATARWFAKDEAVDEQIRHRFGRIIEQARAGQLDAWAESPRSWLALLIALDQFPRNAYRDDPRAFASDPKALAMAMHGIARGLDRQLALPERVFAYLPLEHAETIDRQEQSVSLFETLEAAAEPAQRKTFAMFLDYAKRHRDVIRRFGRFPHRNAILGRTSTEDEAAYLAQPGSGF